MKKRDLDLIIDYCKHEIDDPSFMSVNVKTIYQIENGDNTDALGATQQDVFKVDKQIFADQKRAVCDLIDEIKEGKKLAALYKNKKFTKMVESVTDGEMERFAEFIVVSGKSKEFDELVKMLD